MTLNDLKITSSANDVKKELILKIHDYLFHNYPFLLCEINKEIEKVIKLPIIDNNIQLDRTIDLSNIPELSNSIVHLVMNYLYLLGYDNINNVGTEKIYFSI